MMASPGRLRYLYVVWAFVETMLFGGLIYGWSSLVFILKAKFVYQDLCSESQVAGPDNKTSNMLRLSITSSPLDNSTPIYIMLPPDQNNNTIVAAGCEAQDSMLNLVFTVASTLFCAGCAAMGHINFKFGTRVTRVLSMLTFVAGTLMIAFVSQDIPWLIFPGLTLVGVGGIPLLVTNTQIANLFSRGSSTIIGLLCGAFDISAAVQLVIKIAFERGFSLRNSYLIVTGLHSMVIVSTFFFLPRGFITKPEERPPQEQVTYTVEDGEAPSVVLLEKAEEAGVVIVDGKQPLKEESKAPLTSPPKLPTLFSCILSSSFILHVLWLSILQLRFYYFLSSLNPILNDVLHGDMAQVSYYTNVSMYMMLAGIVTSPFAGVVYDWQKGFFNNSRSKLRRDLMPSVMPLMTGTVLGLLVTVFCMIPAKQVLYLTFITVVFFRSFLYCMGAAFMGAVFPSEYFGLLYGLMIIAGGIFSFIQYGLFKWAEQSGYFQVNIFFLVLVSVSFIHPVFQWIRSRRAESVELTQEEQ
ncbi:equilibrative nucleobase transporter 1-like [Haliotis rufescens]|uniref:equilibrative nucleobase transporter 1-like n=1 Tax=Haliotis rufescens TaxID=6454 RepID=UPI00201EDC73|nr:equilibrative nucleobase transporter 1-like [Haliotis rufescens]XP_048248237.1 equilibrative nucleobase transporter 1-like [Haliotis rufescens]XP_048248238.1 equilibrative nucleobase transporter 1-like [Haliotis rufescens]